MLEIGQDAVELRKRIAASTKEFVDTLNRPEQKAIGQFTTPLAVADYMADRLLANWKPVNASAPIHILDPGAGTGVLGLALAEKLFSQYPAVQVSLTAYENDPIAAKVLRQNLATTQAWAKEHQLNFAFTVHMDDYILDHAGNPETFIQRDTDTYDLVIANPPYKKMRKDSPEAKAMHVIVYGAPNLYGFFWAKTAIELKKHGLSAFIIPRSWMSGAYFYRLRNFMLAEGSLMEVHSFKERTNIFGTTKVMQELVIVLFYKGGLDHIRFWQLPNVHQLDQGQAVDIPTYQAVTGAEKRVYNLVTAADLHALKWAQSLPSTFAHTCLRMKTGLTVAYRNKEFLVQEPQVNTAPIFFADNLRHHTVKIGRKGPQFLKAARSGLLQTNMDYIFVKRFSTKEESRRIQTAYYSAADYPVYREISTDNKLDFVIATNLNLSILRGAFLVLSSTQFDRYYRLVNGNTQVNATEVNDMKFPNDQQLTALAEQFSVADLKALTQHEIDAIVDEHFPGGL